MNSQRVNKINLIIMQEFQLQLEDKMKKIASLYEKQEKQEKEITELVNFLYM